MDVAIAAGLGVLRLWMLLPMVTMASAAMADEQTVRRLTWDDA